MKSHRLLGSRQTVEGRTNQPVYAPIACIPFMIGTNSDGVISFGVGVSLTDLPMFVAYTPQVRSFESGISRYRFPVFHPINIVNNDCQSKILLLASGMFAEILLKTWLWEVILARISHITQISERQNVRLGMGNGLPDSGICSAGHGNSHIAGCGAWHQVGVGMAQAIPFGSAFGSSRPTYGLVAILL